ncbi:MAG TPA: helix-hairpin-helix domain-containing protein [Terriglobia bacterium]|nr:helix-hairpin-helix domain-containing protein [Terriglobia bacterium]
MTAKNSANPLFFLSLLLALGLWGCTSSGQSKQDQNAQDQKLRDEVASATEKAKQQSKQAVQKLNEASQQVEQEAQAAAEGAKEGWNRDNTQPLDLNSATETDLESLPGMTREAAEEIIAGRPYRSKQELTARGVLSREEYSLIEGRLTVRSMRPNRAPRLRLDDSAARH